jgi:hypothetical protein
MKKPIAFSRSSERRPATGVAVAMSCYPLSCGAVVKAGRLWAFEKSSSDRPLRPRGEQALVDQLRSDSGDPGGAIGREVAGEGLEAAYLKVQVACVKRVPERWRWLRGAAVAQHAFVPRVAGQSVGRFARLGPRLTGNLPLTIGLMARRLQNGSSRKCRRVPVLRCSRQPDIKHKLLREPPRAPEGQRKLRRKAAFDTLFTVVRGNASTNLTCFGFL